MRVRWIATALFVAGCSPTLVVQKFQEPSASSASSESSAPHAEGAASASGDDGPSLLVTYPLAPDIARIAVLADKHPNRSAQVLAVFDFHTDADSEDKGFDQLRLAAWRVGADAVIGAEFEHGEGGGKSHLSGMAVRFLDQ